MQSDRDYLLSLQAVRAHAAIVLEAAKDDGLNHFDYHASKLDVAASFVVDLIERDFGPDNYAKIPPHGRWQHFEIGGVPRVANLIKRWTAEQGVDKLEVTRRLIDLFFVSVLLDAGAGDVWKFKEPGTENFYARSEGIAVASLYMFTAGAFSGSATKESVDGKGLTSLQEANFSKYFQISEDNLMVEVSSRIALLQATGRSLLNLSEIFGESGRPGNLVDYLIAEASGKPLLDYETLWKCLQTVLIPSWPSDRTLIDGQPIGDAWPLAVLANKADAKGETGPRTRIQPFHKLTQWLAYSLVVPFTRQLGYEWANLSLGTGLPEYRNGGLLVDLGVLTLKPEDEAAGRAAAGGGDLPLFDASSDVIVEWRAMTVALLDELHKVVAKKFGDKGVALSMAQMLEAGTWKSGRELAAKHRPETKSSPILVISDGTLY